MLLDLFLEFWRIMWNIIFDVHIFDNIFPNLTGRFFSFIRTKRSQLQWNLATVEASKYHSCDKLEKGFEVILLLFWVLEPSCGNYMLFKPTLAVVMKIVCYYLTSLLWYTFGSISYISSFIDIIAFIKKVSLSIL